MILWYLEAEGLISLKVWLCGWGQSLTCAAWLVCLFSWNWQHVGQRVQLWQNLMDGALCVLLRNSGGGTTCTSKGFQAVCNYFSPSHVASSTGENFHLCLQNVSLCKPVWKNYSLLLCFYTVFILFLPRTISLKVCNFKLSHDTLNETNLHSKTKVKCEGKGSHNSTR